MNPWYPGIFPCNSTEMPLRQASKYIGNSQYEHWKHTQLILDVIEGQGGSFSLEGSTGKAFHARSRLFTDEEYAEILASEGNGP